VAEEEKPKRKVRDGDLRNKVPGVLVKHRGLDVPIAQIIHETGCERASIQGCTAHLISRDSLPITVVIRGNMYRYEFANAQQPTDESDKKIRLYEEVGLTRNEEIIVRDEHGTLFRLTDL
jgi:hypothetical protein